MIENRVQTHLSKDELERIASAAAQDVDAPLSYDELADALRASRQDTQALLEEIALLKVEAGTLSRGHVRYLLRIHRALKRHGLEVTAGYFGDFIRSHSRERRLAELAQVAA
jgi:hypothetical protein